MTIRVREAVEADRPAWDAFVGSCPEADVLQLWGWGDVWRPEGQSPRRIVAADASGAIRALGQALVRPTTAGRSIVYVPHGPLWPRREVDGDELFDVVIEKLVALATAEKAVVVKLDPRAGADDEDGFWSAIMARHRLRHARQDLQARTTRVVELLDGATALAATWDGDVRRKVRRAARERVTTIVDRAASSSAIAAFMTIFDQTSERGGFHARSGEFIEHLAAELSATGGWYLTLALLDDRPLAGVVTPRVGDRAFYLYGASTRDPATRHAYGSDAAMAAAMAALASDGVRTLDMWGVVERDDPSADPSWEGFSLFKRRFGGSSIRHPGTFDLVIDQPAYLLRDARERLTAAIGRSR